MRILAIETSCDETALAIVDCKDGAFFPRFRVIKSLVSSQIDIHAPFGGVVPNLAKREHLKNLPLLFSEIAGPKEKEMKKVEAIAVTVGPGLEPALWTGINFAQELAKKFGLPLLRANHLEGHLYSFLLETQKSRISPEKVFPSVALVVSGGHTLLLSLKDMSKRKMLGETRDDAAGEAFDKVSRLLNLPYPGGPQIQKIAAGGNPQSVAFPRPMMADKNYDFSFSGLKTAVLYHLRDTPLQEGDEARRADIAASFQQAVVDVLRAKTLRAARETKAKSVTLSGGVAANTYLREALQRACESEGFRFFVPEFTYNTDNAVMMAVAAYITKDRAKKYPLKANGSLGI